MVQRFCLVDVDELVKLRAWIEAIPFEAWPQDHRDHPDKIRPAMATKLDWFGFGEKTDPIVEDLLLKVAPEVVRRDPRLAFGKVTGRLIANNRMLSVVMPGASIHAHTDNPSADWRVRVHVPLMTNEKAVFIVEGVPHHLEVGLAYLVNVRQMHEIRNEGLTPRIHFMFDVVEGYDG